VTTDWCAQWLHPDFQDCDLCDVLASVGCPVLILQGMDDPFGSMLHADEIIRRSPGPATLHLLDCGHTRTGKMDHLHI
jgi:pimeloyl-ACP methyl ester carboxylesterase